MNAKDWPQNPGVAVRDFRTLGQWKNDMDQPIRMTPTGVRLMAEGLGWSANLRALALACYEQEGGATRLAVEYNNLFGIIWSDTAYNRRTYRAVRFEGNSHDQSVGTPTRYYRADRDWETRAP